MRRNFYDVMVRRNDLLHQRAIWQEVVEHLTKFLDTDSTSATVGIKTDGGGLVVPQDRIELTLNEIKNGYMAEIDGELNKINKSEVAENVKQIQGSKTKAKQSKGKEVKGKAVKGKAREAKRTRVSNAPKPRPKPNKR